jgi:hypothetical protein
MIFSQQSLIAELNSPYKNTRLHALAMLIGNAKTGLSMPEPDPANVNSHIHTTYSFSPYSPTKAIWQAKNAGLLSAGIMDHDSICGAWEFIAAGQTAGIATTIGIECRVDFSNTVLNGRMINNPDQISNAYIALHGIPHTMIDNCKAFFEPLIAAREKRNRLMIAKMNKAIAQTGILLDYSSDVLPLSQRHDGGTVTERHLLYALVLALINKFGQGLHFIQAVATKLNIPVSDSFNTLLLDAQNPYYDYDALALLKKEFVKDFYINATDECPDVRVILAFAKKCNCICAYSYLGDVIDSITKDKKDQKFEDDYLDELIVCIKDLGFKAITYMPSRNSAVQLSRISNLCQRNGFFQISGEDINSPRQAFTCKALREKKFSNLVDATWALIGHEWAATKNTYNGFFSEQTIAKYPDINHRLEAFKALGQTHMHT